ncbi:MAG TPA: hypothetical protein VHN11_06190 [Xanthobacteraceae bacterium]|nr:hypothetical protein [Xanthobacteraceae bacterium]
MQFIIRPRLLVSRGAAILCAAALISMLPMAFAVPALAQSGMNSTRSNGESQAPAGHRQPRKQDVSATKNDQRASDPKDVDRELERLLKGICRGC